MPTSALAIVILLNGVPLDFGQVPERLKPSLRDGVVMVPARPVLEGIGARVDTNGVSATRKNWDEVYVTYQGKEVSLRQEYSKVSKQAEQVYWPSKRKVPAAYTAKAFVASTNSAGDMRMVSRLMMPLGFLSSTFDFSLKWDEKRRIVEIKTAR